jgi:aspartate racemase
VEAAQRVIGLIGGLSWESTAEYYRIINQAVRARLGGTHSARILLWSFDFARVEALQRAGQWDEATALMVDAAQRLERGGADLLVICTNTMHRMAAEIEAATSLPLLHIVDPTAARVRAMNLSTVALLGTAYTMEMPFFRDRLAQRYGLRVLVPGEEDRRLVHRVIYDELVRGRIEPASRAAYREVIARLVAQGAEGVVLGCTEIALLVRPEDSTVPLFDTTTLHAEAAAKYAIDGG